MLVIIPIAVATTYYSLDIMQLIYGHEYDAASPILSILIWTVCLLFIAGAGNVLLNASHKIIGQLHGGLSNCESGTSGPEWFGKFSSAWAGDSSIPAYDTIYRRLYCWLDSLNTGAQTMEGLLVVPATRTICTDQQLYSNIRIKSTGQLTIQCDIELMGNSRVIVESGGKLIIDGGTFSNVDIDLKAGASLRIINGGVMETRNGFKAPVGAKVEIINGKIKQAL